MKTLLLFISFFGIANSAMAQDSIEQYHRMNTIKFEFTQALYPKSFVLSYERITRPNQSFCISGGYEEFPPLVRVNSTTKVKDNLDKSGYKVGAEYRFYLGKENKHLAPHGVYMGPYFTFHDFLNVREIEIDVEGVKETANLRTDFNISNIGFQIGYQFVINNRWTIDVVMFGPAYSNYRVDIKTDADFTFDKENVENEVLLKILDRFPLLDNLLTDKEVSAQGRFDSWSFGWRYQFHIGYQFGKLKKKNK
jgi:hypothetical protein